MDLNELKKRKDAIGYEYDEIAELADVEETVVREMFEGNLEQVPRELRFKVESVLNVWPGKVMETEALYTSYHREEKPVPVKKQGNYTLDDYYDLPEDRRAELIDGVVYDMTAPNVVHQELVYAITHSLKSYIKTQQGKCMVFMSPVDVRLMMDQKTMVQPDVMVVCDRSKIIRSRIEGAPDFLVEVLSKSTKTKDMLVKSKKYQEAGVREYWMIDAEDEKVIVYLFEDEVQLRVYEFGDQIPVSIFDGECIIDMKRICEENRFVLDLPWEE